MSGRNIPSPAIVFSGKINYIAHHSNFAMPFVSIQPSDSTKQAKRPL